MSPYTAKVISSSTLRRNAHRQGRRILVSHWESAPIVESGGQGGVKFGVKNR